MAGQILIGCGVMVGTLALYHALGPLSVGAGLIAGASVNRCRAVARLLQPIHSTGDSNDNRTA